MEDTSGTYNTNEMPSLLDIKPVEQFESIQEVVKEEDEVVETIEEERGIFVRPPTNNIVKKKKVLSEKQKAHLEKLRLKRLENSRLKKAQKEKEQLLKLKAMMEKGELKEEKAPEKKEIVREEITRSSRKSKNEKQEVLDEFFTNMERFVSLSNKITDFRTKTVPVKVPKNDPFKDMKPVKQQPKPKPKPIQVNFLESNARYNYKNPFGF